MLKEIRDAQSVAQITHEHETLSGEGKDLSKLGGMLGNVNQVTKNHRDPPTIARLPKQF